MMKVDEDATSKSDKQYHDLIAWKSMGRSPVIMYAPSTEGANQATSHRRANDAPHMNPSNEDGSLGINISKFVDT
jgi:hypothetical protein